MSRSPANRESGFAILWVMMLATALALSSAALLQAAAQGWRKSAENELLAVGGEFTRAFQRYAEATPAGSSPYPRRLEDLVQDPRFTAPHRYLRQVYADPLTGKTDWGLLLSADGGIAGVHSLSGGKPLRRQSAPGTTNETYRDWHFGYQLPPTPAH
ncbi:type II secretion system protein [Niveibacterium sp. SC-1]|uniref:type II secretion system protein n=1 Tax=Niveibacterium sp. SC-1 TaxID=3135646 RepID=UPI00311E56C3